MLPLVEVVPNPLQNLAIFGSSHHQVLAPRNCVELWLDFILLGSMVLPDGFKFALEVKHAVIGVNNFLLGWVDDVLDALLEDVPVLEAEEGALLLHLGHNSRVYFRQPFLVLLAVGNNFPPETLAML